MAISEFVGTTWQPLDLIDETKMDDMANGIQWVHDNTPRAKVDIGSGGARSIGVKIASGRVTVPRNMKKDADTVPARFGGFFSPGCSPTITTGIASPMQTNIFVTFRGLSRLQPDHNGMTIEIEVGEKDGEKTKIRRSFQVHWIALGY